MKSERNMLTMKNRTPGTWYLQAQNKPAPDETRIKTSLDAQISQRKYIRGIHVGSEPPGETYHHHRTNAS